jgi:chemotaxis protein MotB
MAVSGCVTRGTFDEVVADRDQLETTRKRLEAQVALLIESNNNLDEERALIADSLEDLRQSNVILSSDLGKVRKSEALLSDHLEDRENRLSRATKELTNLRSTYTSLVEDLEEEVESGHVEIEQLREGIRVNLAQEILFASGSAELSGGGQKVLRKVARGFSGATYLIEVQGHTDNVPTSARLAKRFKTNWELAGARATEVVRVLAEAGVDPTRLRATSYGPFQPIATNDSREGRAKNRRIEIRLTPLKLPNSADIAAGK